MAAGEPARSRLRHATAWVLATLALALLVAAGIARQPPDFAALPVVAIIGDTAHRPFWSLRLAPAADELAADALHAPPPPTGHAYQAWLVAPAGTPPAWLGVLPETGRKVLPLRPWLARRFAGAGAVIVTIVPTHGSPTDEPTGPALFRARLSGPG